MLDLQTMTPNFPSWHPISLSAWDPHTARTNQAASGVFTWIPSSPTSLSFSFSFSNLIQYFIYPYIKPHIITSHFSSLLLSSLLFSFQIESSSIQTKNTNSHRELLSKRTTKTCSQTSINNNNTTYFNLHVNAKPQKKMKPEAAVAPAQTNLPPY